MEEGIGGGRDGGREGGCPPPTECTHIVVDFTYCCSFLFPHPNLAATREKETEGGEKERKRLGCGCGLGCRQT